MPASLFLVLLLLWRLLPIRLLLLWLLLLLSVLVLRMTISALKLRRSNVLCLNPVLLLFRVLLVLLIRRVYVTRCLVLFPLGILNRVRMLRIMPVIGLVQPLRLSVPLKIGLVLRLTARIGTSRGIIGVVVLCLTLIQRSLGDASSSFIWSVSSSFFSWSFPFSPCRSSDAYWFQDVMLCRDPFVKAGAAYPCGRCAPCLHSRRRVWAHRIMLEAMCHNHNSFLTLTYADKNLPMTSERDGSALASLSPVHLRDWLKRLRTRISPLRIRFYAVGEYGDETGRPHYHVILFGFPTCDRGRTLRRGISLEPIWSDCCDRCRLVGDSWGHGNVDLGQVTKDSSGYIAGYVVKKMNRFDDPRLNGRFPEFCRMSTQNGGIGKDALWEVASSLMYHHLDERPDVPAALRVASRSMPLGRYLRSKLREMIGRDGSAPSETLDAIKAELLPVSDYAFNNSKSLKATVVEVNDGAFANFEAKARIYKGRKSL